MRCFGCQHEFVAGERYIKDTASGFIDAAPNPETDSLIAELFGGRGDKVVFCEDCTQDGGRYMAETFDGDEEAEDAG